jgi:hypothetical protein
MIITVINQPLQHIAEQYDLFCGQGRKHFFIAAQHLSHHAVVYLVALSRQLQHQRTAIIWIFARDNQPFGLQGFDQAAGLTFVHQDKIGNIARPRRHPRLDQRQKPPFVQTKIKHILGPKMAFAFANQHQPPQLEGDHVLNRQNVWMLAARPQHPAAIWHGITPRRVKIIRHKKPFPQVCEIKLRQNTQNRS